MASTSCLRPCVLPCNSSLQGRRKNVSSTVRVTATANQQHTSMAVAPFWQQSPATRPTSSPFTDNDVAFLRSGGLTIEEGQRLNNQRLDLSEKQVLAIATDVDGTLLDSNQELSERTERALQLAQEQGVQIILATGKTRGPWVHDVISRLNLRTPGVFLQGLLVCDADGGVLYERTMSQEMCEEVVTVAEEEGITLVACNGERILCNSTDHHTDRLIGYGEPTPEAVGDLREVVPHTGIHKFLLMADDDILSELRPRLEQRLDGRASLVTALHGMLEVLPLGASKAVGLTHALKSIGVSPAHIMAAGDGENDIEMLQMAGLSVAMGNARSSVKAIADVISQTNDEDGLAAAVERYVLPAGLWCWD